MSVRLHRTAGYHWVDFRKNLYLRLFEKVSEKCRFHYNLTGITGTLDEHVCTFMIICR